MSAAAADIQNQKTETYRTLNDNEANRFLVKKYRSNNKLSNTFVELHNGDLAALAYHELIIWDAKTSVVKRKFFTNSKGSEKLTLLKNGLLLAWEDRTIIAINVTTEEVSSINTDAFTFALAELPGGILAFGGILGLNLYYASNFSIVKKLENGKSSFVFSLAADWHRGLLASGGFDGTIKIWNMNENYKWERTLQAASQAIHHLTWLPDGNMVSDSFERSILIWNVADDSWSIIKRFVEGKPIQFVKIMSNGDLLSASYQSIYIWNQDNGLLKGKLPLEDNGEVKQLRNGLLGAINGNDINVYESEMLLSSFVQNRWLNHSSYVSALGVLPNGDLCSGSWDATVKVWSSSGTVRHTLVGHLDAVSSLAVTSSGLLASGSRDSTVKVWNPSDGTEQFTFRAHTSSVECLAALADDLLASGSNDRTVRIWRAGREDDASSLKFTLVGHSAAVTALTVLTSIGPGKVFLASGSVDKTICIWNMADGSLRNRLSGAMQDVLSLVQLPSGLLASASSDRKIRLWDVNEARLTNTLGSHSYYVVGVQTLANGDLVSASWDKSICVWNSLEGRLKATLRSYDVMFTSLAVLADGKSVATGGQDGSILIWSIGE